MCLTFLQAWKGQLIEDTINTGNRIEISRTSWSKHIKCISIDLLLKYCITSNFENFISPCRTSGGFYVNNTADSIFLKLISLLSRNFLLPREIKNFFINLIPFRLEFHDVRTHLRFELITAKAKRFTFQMITNSFKECMTSVPSLI